MFMTYLPFCCDMTTSDCQTLTYFLMQICDWTVQYHVINICDNSIKNVSPIHFHLNIIESEITINLFTNVQL